jgi:hypothetical protein
MKMTLKTHLAILFLATVLTSKASETYTNWTWASLGLSVPETNSFLGEKFTANLIISNTVQKQQTIHWIADDSCGRGFADFSIIELSSGRKMPCRLSFSDRGSVTLTGETVLRHNDSKAFSFNLATAYWMTNAGAYSVQATAWLPASEPSTNNQFTPVTTSPILVFLSSKPETNALPK